MLSVKQKQIKAHCNTFHSIFNSFFNSSPFDSLGYIYYDNNGNYFGIQSDSQLYDKLINTELKRQTIYNYYTEDPQKIHVENIHLNNENILLKTISHMHYKSIIRVVNHKNGITEFISFYSKQHCPVTTCFFLNNKQTIQNIIKTIKRRISQLANKQNFTQFDISYDQLKNNPKEFKQSLNHDKTDDELFLNTEGIPLSLDKYKLVNREKEVAILMYYGFTIEEMALKLEVSRRTIDRRLNSIRRKLNCKTNINIMPMLLSNETLHY